MFVVLGPLVELAAAAVGDRVVTRQRPAPASAAGVAADPADHGGVRRAVDGRTSSAQPPSCSARSAAVLERHPVVVGVQVFASKPSMR
jgi:hypothetical protein